MHLALWPSCPETANHGTLSGSGGSSFWGGQLGLLCFDYSILVFDVGGALTVRVHSEQLLHQRQTCRISRILLWHGGPHTSWCRRRCHHGPILAQMYLCVCGPLCQLLFLFQQERPPFHLKLRTLDWQQFSAAIAATNESSMLESISALDTTAGLDEVFEGNKQFSLWFYTYISFVIFFMRTIL
jgi:hypothetical protein